MKLLIVDSNALVRTLIRCIVAAVAQEVYECNNGAEALAACAAICPDVILTDLVLDGSDGLDIARRIVSAQPDTRVIVVTDYDDPDLREAARNAGASGYVLKEELMTGLVPALIASDHGTSGS